MDYKNYETMLFSRDQAVLTVSLNRPEQLNAVGPATERELCRFFFEVVQDMETRVVILTGIGRAFSAGGDIPYMRRMIDEPSQMWNALNDGKRLIFSMLDCPKPLIAKINGHAIGLGATLALFCDVSFMADNARIGDPHVAIGFVAGDGGAVIWPQLIGYNRAKEYLFTGYALSASDAERLGLINHAVPTAELDQRVGAYAAKVAGMPMRALQWTKASVNIGLKQLAHSIMDASLAYEALSNFTPDHREAVDAMLEKRTPSFRHD